MKFTQNAFCLLQQQIAASEMMKDMREDMIEHMDKSGYEVDYEIGEEIVFKKKETR